jgi:hypothetical protein
MADMVVDTGFFCCLRFFLTLASKVYTKKLELTGVSLFSRDEQKTDKFRTISGQNGYLFTLEIKETFSHKPLSLWGKRFSLIKTYSEKLCKTVKDTRSLSRGYLESQARQSKTGLYFIILEIQSSGNRLEDFF